MKGRANYLCLHRSSRCGRGPRPGRRRPAAAPIGADPGLVGSSPCGPSPSTGDRAELEDLPETCRSGTTCRRPPTRASARVPAVPGVLRHAHAPARRRSDIVIVNHHLLCADASVRQSAYGEVIPACQHVVVDEAHQLEDVATQYFGVSVSNYRVDELVRDGRAAAEERGGDRATAALRRADARATTRGRSSAAWRWRGPRAAPAEERLR
jgi:ATP-dependent DNA helicase DinG